MDKELEFNEEELMNDPELLKELAQLMGTPAKAPGQSKPVVVSPPPTAVNAEKSEAKSDGELEIPEEVEIDEHELPELMKELQLLGGGGSQEEPQSAAGPAQPLKAPAKAQTSLEAKPVVARKPVTPKNTPEIPPQPVQKVPATSNVATKRKPPVAADAPPVALPPKTADTATPKNDAINALIQKQIDICGKLASDYFKLAKKDDALHFHKYKKQFILDQTLIQQSTFTRINVRYEMYRFNWEVPIDALSFTVDAVTGLTVDFQFKIDSPFSDATINSSTLKPPASSFSHSFKVENTKTFQRYLEKKKLSVELYQPRFLRSAIFIGKLSIPLADLLTKSTIAGPFQIMDASNRRPIGAFVEGSLKLRKPFAAAVDVEIVTEPWIITNEPSFYSFILDSTPSSNTAPPRRPSSEQKKEVINTALQARKDMKAKPKSPTTAQPPAPSQTLATPDLEEMMMKFDAIQTTSNNVLESELAKLMLQPSANKDKIEAVQLQMNVLVIQVQTGALSMDAYLEKLKGEVQELKKLCLSFKRAGSVDYAKRSLERVKIIEAEIASASQMNEEE